MVTKILDDIEGLDELLDWDDLIKIPRFIQENCKDYVMALRKYPSVYMPFYDGIQQVNELVLYAIPIERYRGTERM